jgi:hypothetical protein
VEISVMWQYSSRLCCDFVKPPTVKICRLYLSRFMISAHHTGTMQIWQFLRDFPIAATDVTFDFVVESCNLLGEIFISGMIAGV